MEHHLKCENFLLFNGFLTKELSLLLNWCEPKDAVFCDTRVFEISFA